jgi:hypothetical protein
MILSARPVPSTHVLTELQRALRYPPASPERLGRWRWTVRQRMFGVRDLLLAEADRPESEWLAPRHGVAVRERRTLLQRWSALGRQVLEDAEVEPVRLEALRLLDDVRHHLQRCSDLAWDDVEEELGGSD